MDTARNSERRLCGENVLQIGNLDQRVLLQSKTIENVRGEVVNTYSDIATVWGSVITQRGNEAFEASRTNAIDIIRVKIRYRSDLKTDWRVSWQGQFYNVESVDRSQRREGAMWFTARLLGAF